MPRQLLAQLLREAADAHHKYEERLGHSDADWPTWYANFVIDELDRRAAEKAEGSCCHL